MFLSLVKKVQHPARVSLPIDRKQGHAERMRSTFPPVIGNISWTGLIY